ncbi:Protein phosphatase methylesterase 1 [Halotydeus destructor]|nr:Protein phosphatase methylesterase 1 [Halotydeus destructor]
MRKNFGHLPPRPAMAGARGLPKRPGREFTPLPWSDYFESMRDVDVSSSSSFRVYLSGFSDNKDYGNKPLLVLLHGAGYSGLTWSLFAKNICRLCHCKIAAIDLRGHGSTRTNNDDDLSASTLAHDVGYTIKALLAEEEDSEPPIVLIGHSMGGAIAAHCAMSCTEVIPSLTGLIVIDVVEGTAIDALQGMQSVLRSRPSEFRDVQHAIEWSVKSGQTRNQESARVSMPGQLKTKDGVPASGIEFTAKQEMAADIAPPSVGDMIAEVNEDDEQPMNVEAQNLPDSPQSLVWRTDLMKSEPFWKGWFEGLSNMFLSSTASAKMLLLAGVDRLDKTMTVGQMQGKFQMQVLPQCGHAVHEDVPEKVAQVIAQFLIRNRLTQAKEDFQLTFPCC